MPSFTLYYAPRTCGTASYLAATLSGASFARERVNLQTHTTQSGADFYKINPRGTVPTLVLADGSVLSQSVATLTYLADLAPHTGLAPSGAMRYAYLDKLGFVNSELHPAFLALLPCQGRDAQPAERHAVAKGRVRHFVDVVKDGDFAMGDTLSVVDLYAYSLLSLADALKLDLKDVPDVREFCARVEAAPGVQDALDSMDAET